MLPNLQFPETPDLATFTEEILNGKLHFLRCANTLKTSMRNCTAHKAWQFGTLVCPYILVNRPVAFSYFL